MYETMSFFFLFLCLCSRYFQSITWLLPQQQQQQYWQSQSERSDGSTDFDILFSCISWLIMQCQWHTSHWNCDFFACELCFRLITTVTIIFVVEWIIGRRDREIFRQPDHYFLQRFHSIFQVIYSSGGITEWIDSIRFDWFNEEYFFFNFRMDLFDESICYLDQMLTYHRRIPKNSHVY